MVIAEARYDDKGSGMARDRIDHRIRCVIGRHIATTIIRLRRVQSCAGPCDSLRAQTTCEYSPSSGMSSTT